MKLLKEYYSLQQAEQEAFRLETLGILTFISAESTHRMGGYATGAFQVGLWAVLEKQYQDAEMALADLSFIPSSALSPSELENLKVGGADQALTTMLKTSGKILLGIAVVAATTAYLYRYWIS